MVPRLLVVEDDARIGRLLVGALTEDGHQVAWARDGAEALAAADREPVDLVLLDLGLPDSDGLQVCHALRARQPGCVVVVLTARGEALDVVAGLEAGADDYLTKPFTLEVLLARIRAHLRREGHGARDGQTAAGLLRRFGDLEVDPAARRCRLGGAEVTLRAREFELLARLARDSGVAVSRETLMAEVWDEHWFGSTKTLDVHVATLRRRLAEAVDEAAAEGRTLTVPVITTLRGFGYRLDPPVEEEAECEGESSASP